MRQARKVAPPGGRGRTTTSSPGRVISASCGATGTIGSPGPSLRFGTKIDPAGNSEQTILVAGCGTKKTSREDRRQSVDEANGDVVAIDIIASDRRLFIRPCDRCRRFALGVE